MIHTARPAKRSGNHRAGTLENLWLEAHRKAAFQKWFSYILLTQQMTSEEREPRGAMKNKCKFLLLKFRSPVLSASHTLELCFYLSYPFFSTVSFFCEAIMLSQSHSHTLACGSCWTLSSFHIGQICSSSRIPLCLSNCCALQQHKGMKH